jgi:rRNA processing protein Gar1
MENRSDRFTAIEDQYAGYEVYDRNGEKIGKVDDLFVDENDQPEYLGVKMDESYSLGDHKGQRRGAPHRGLGGQGSG